MALLQVKLERTACKARIAARRIDRAELRHSQRGSTSPIKEVACLAVCKLLSDVCRAGRYAPCPCCTTPSGVIAKYTL